MRIIPRKFQEGGAVEAAPVEEAPVEEQPVEQQAPQGGEDPMMMLIQLAMQALQNQDCQAAMQVCQALVQLVQQSAQPSEPVFARKGAKLIRRK